MRPEDINFATECVRGMHTALAAFRRWVATKQPDQHDEALLKHIENLGEAIKEWLRSKVRKLGNENPSE